MYKSKIRHHFLIGYPLAMAESAVDNPYLIRNIFLFHYQILRDGDFLWTVTSRGHYFSKGRVLLNKVSTKIIKNVHENSPKKRTSCGHFFQENSPKVSTRIHPFCKQEKNVIAHGLNQCSTQTLQEGVQIENTIPFQVAKKITFPNGFLLPFQVLP